MRRNLFWLSDEQWQRIGPLLPTDVRGKARVRRPAGHQRHLACIEERLPMVRLPAGVRPSETIYNRFVRWAKRGVWERLFRELAAPGTIDLDADDHSTHIKAHRSASGGKGGSRNRRLAAHVAGAIRKSTQSQMLEAVFFPSC